MEKIELPEKPVPPEDIEDVLPEAVKANRGEAPAKPLHNQGDKVKEGIIVLITNYLDGFVYSVRDSKGKISKIAEKDLIK